MWCTVSLYGEVPKQCRKRLNKVSLYCEQVLTFNVDVWTPEKTKQNLSSAVITTATITTILMIIIITTIIREKEEREENKQGSVLR
jgi:hypothetical protein